MLNEAHLRDLLEKAVAGKASDEELGMLADALKSDADYEVIDQIAAFLNKQNAAYTLPTEERMSRLVDEILEADKLSSLPAIPARPRAPIVALWKKIAVAAVVIVAATATIYLWKINKQPAEVLTGNEVNKNADVNPGNNKARLTLADGSTVVLDTMANGTLSVQGNARISKCNDGQVSYTAEEAVSKANDPTTTLYNTITVPRGGQYKLILADGTEVWLNAASSLRFPVTFTGQERIVELEGEGYFEVAKDAARPFSVHTKQADVRVLGTHFNVCAYPEEDWKTTLLEGSVAVDSWSRQGSGEIGNTATTNLQQSIMLKPGQQAVIALQSSKSNQSSKIMVQTADIDEAIAWKEGYFQFNDASVPFIMQQVSRWYDVDIVYKDMAGKGRFNGRINRNIKLSGIVNALKEGGINCVIEQSRLLVYP